MSLSIESLLSQYHNQASYVASNHVDGHADWLSGTEDDVGHTDKHEDCDSL